MSNTNKNKINDFVLQSWIKFKLPSIQSIILTCDKQQNSKIQVMHVKKVQLEANFETVYLFVP